MQALCTARLHLGPTGYWIQVSTGHHASPFLPKSPRPGGFARILEPTTTTTPLTLALEDSILGLCVLIGFELGHLNSLIHKPSILSISYLATDPRKEQEGVWSGHWEGQSVSCLRSRLFKCFDSDIKQAPGAADGSHSPRPFRLIRRNQCNHAAS